MTTTVTLKSPHLHGLNFVDKPAIPRLAGKVRQRPDRVSVSLQVQATTTV
jgi:hypothetical protein